MSPIESLSIDGKRESFGKFLHKAKTNADCFWSRIISKIDKGKDIITFRKTSKESLSQRQESGLNGVWYVFKNKKILHFLTNISKSESIIWLNVRFKLKL